MSPIDAATLRARQTDDGYLLPAYEDWCFARIPGTVADLLGADVGPALPAGATEGYDDVSCVVVFLVDGFGLAQWEREAPRTPFLRRVERAGRVTPLTSVFPSETAAAMNTYHTAALPSSHGVIGWNVYDPAADEQFEALPFRRKDGTEPRRITRGEVVDAESVYPTLADAGVDTHRVSPFAGDAAGVTPHPYDESDLSTFPAAFEAAAETASDPAYVFAYLPQTDAVAHREGTASDAYREVVSETFERLTGAVETFSAVRRDAAGETLVCVTADHGILDTDPETNVDLSGPPFDVVADLLRQADGTPVRYAGSPRNVHLHLDPERVDAVAERLDAELDAAVYRKREVLDAGLFGPDPSEAFERRLGDLLVVHRDRGVWYGEESHTLRFVGMHGGLHPDEMLVPFATARLDDLA